MALKPILKYFLLVLQLSVSLRPKFKHFLPIPRLWGQFWSIYCLSHGSFLLSGQFWCVFCLCRCSEAHSETFLAFSVAFSCSQTISEVFFNCPMPPCQSQAQFEVLLTSPQAPWTRKSYQESKPDLFNKNFANPSHTCPPVLQNTPRQMQIRRFVSGSVPGFGLSISICIRLDICRVCVSLYSNRHFCCLWNLCPNCASSLKIR